MHSVAEMKTIDTDVLIVGAGGAGLRAAFEADNLGADVTLVDKSIIGRGGATVTALCQACAALGFADKDDWRIHFEDTIKAGKLVNNQEMVEVLAKEAPDRLLELERYGLRFDRLENGTIRQERAPGHSRKRAAFVNLHTGQAMVAALLRELKRHPRIRKLNNLLVTRLLVEGGRMAGAVGLDIVRGEVVAFRAPAVVITTGGGSWLYPRNSGGPNLTGDGYALAYRAGAELVDMEFPQFIATHALYPRLLGVNICFPSAVRYRTGGVLLNALGEQFLSHYATEEVMSTRDEQCYAVAMEVRSGRGTAHGGVYCDLSTAGAEVMEQEYGRRFLERVKAAGADIRERPIEVGNDAHFFMGGVRVNPRCEASIAGLYAAGEAAGGVHGANRLSGNALAELFVFGARAGRFAAEYACSAGKMDLSETILAAEAARIHLRRQPRPDGIRPLALRRQMGQLLWEHLGPIRSAQGIRLALDEVRRMRDEDLPRMSPADGFRAYNLDWVEALETERMLDVAEMIAYAASVRKESRGAHFREDYPAPDREWLTNIVIRREGGEIRHRLAPLVVTKCGLSDHGSIPPAAG